MLETIRKGIRRLTAYLKRGNGKLVVPDEPGSQASKIPVMVLSTSSIASCETKAVDLNRWTVTEHVESPFEKVGRIYIVGSDMIIRSDLDTRGFLVPLADINSVIDGDPQSIRLLATGGIIGTVRLSTSGRAMNFSIEPFFYTTPLQSLTRMLGGEQRKTPLFVGRGEAKG
jgi:hypothetical protein